MAPHGEADRNRAPIASTVGSPPTGARASASQATSQKLDSLAAALADLLDAQLDAGDRETPRRRARELRKAIRLEEEI